MIKYAKYMISTYLAENVSPLLIVSKLKFILSIQAAVSVLLPREAMLSAVFAVVVCLCVCHTPVLYQNCYT